jgi:hypothetical protein
MDTQFERRIAILEREKTEACAIIQGLRLALEEAQRQIAELTRLHLCEQGSAGATAETNARSGGSTRSDSRKGGNRG